MTNIVLKLNDNGEITFSDGALAFPSLADIKHYTIEGDVDTTNYDGVHALARGINVAEAANRIVNEIQDIREYAAENDLLEQVENRLDDVENQSKQVPAMVREIFSNDTDDEVEVSPLAMSYIKNNTLAKEVLTVNLTTGIYKGNTPNEESVEVVNEIINDIFNDLFDIRNELGMFEDDEEYWDDEYDDWDEYDYDEWNDDDWYDGELSFDDEEEYEDEDVEDAESNNAPEFSFSIFSTRNDEEDAESEEKEHSSERTVESLLANYLRELFNGNQR